MANQTGQFDAIIIGAGHNGLVAAGYLARAGKKVIVMEKRDRVGGACTLEEPFPGFTMSPCAYVVSLPRPEIIRDLEFTAMASMPMSKTHKCLGRSCYLHWKTREDLFTALLLRESVEASLDMLELINNDPEGIYLHNVAKHAIYVVMTRPLAKALFIGDVEVLGELVKNDRKDIGLISQHKITASQGMFELLRQKGMVHADQDIMTQMKVFNAIFMGFMIVNHYVPEELQLSPEETAEALAESIQRTLEPGEPVSPQALQEVQDIWNQVAQQFMVLLKERLQKEMD